jgi:hypothetical protein
MKNYTTYKKMKALCLLLIALPLFSFVSDKDQWKLERNKNNVKVYTRNIEGSQLKEFQAITTIDGSVNSLLALIKDFGAYHLWIDNYKMAKQIKKVSEDEYYFYLEIATPWPVTNRDIVVHLKFKKNTDGSVIVAMNGLPDYMDKNEKLIRMPKLKGFWKLTPKEDGKTEVICQVHAEPGGSVPDWLANSMMTDGPFNTMGRIGDWASKPKYNIAIVD